jgi:glycosyltransferase involved in cell wall biosynthesis
VENNSLVNYFQKADFFLHGSDFETFSIVAIESLMTGTPVIASRVGVLPDVISIENGALCHNNIEDWTKTIEKSINLTYNHKLIAENIKDYYSEIVISELFDDLYREK